MGPSPTRHKRNNSVPNIALTFLKAFPLVASLIFASPSPGLTTYLLDHLLSCDGEHKTAIIFTLRRASHY